MGRSSSFIFPRLQPQACQRTLGRCTLPGHSLLWCSLRRASPRKRTWTLCNSRTSVGSYPIFHSLKHIWVSENSAKTLSSMELCSRFSKWISTFLRIYISQFLHSWERSLACLTRKLTRRNICQHSLSSQLDRTCFHWRWQWLHIDQ